MIHRMVIHLSDDEKTVLTVVQEYLNKNRDFNLGKVIPFINSRFKFSSVNISFNGIKENLRSLVKKNLIIEGSKLTRQDVLRNPNRNEIYYFIKKNLGVYFNIIANKLNIRKQSLKWHLEVLLKFKFIRKQKNNQLF